MDQRLHVGRTMTRPLWFWLGLLGSCWLPAFALAQSSIGTSTANAATTSSSSGGLLVQLKYVGEQAYTSKALRGTPIGKSDCDAKVNLTFYVSGFSVGASSPKYVEIYKGTNCANTEGRDNLGDDDCVRVSYQNRTQNTTLQQFKIPIEELCSTNGAATVWFLPVDTLDTNATVMPYGVYEVPLDTLAPNAPTNVKGGDGETQIQVSWERSDTNISRNWIIWDPKPITSTVGASDAGLTADGGGADSAAAGSGAAGQDETDADGGTTPIGQTVCGSPLLTPGEAIDVDKLPKGLHRKEARGDVESFQLSGDEIDSPRAAVAVVAQDLAGNVSLLSNVACVNVVDTTGFWDAYQQNGGDAEAGCTCSLPGSRTSTARHTAGGLLAALALLGLAVVRSRRKRLS
jgi:hypothetical protein